MESYSFSFAYFLIINFFCLLPVILFTKSFRKTLLIGFSIIIFSFLYRDFLTGKAGVYHDTFWNGEIIFNIFKQWVDGGFYPGWDPYMNAGEPFYLFSNSCFKATYLLFSLLGGLIKIDGHLLFNQYWIFLFFNFCVGAYLLFDLLFDDFKTAFFCFISLLFSSFFYVNLGQSAGIAVLYFLPYILFGIAASIKHKSPYGLALAAIYLGLACNIYIPIYICLATFFFVVVLFLLNPFYAATVYRITVKHYKIIAFAVFIAVLTLGPVFFLKLEMKDFVSPTRGAFTSGGALSIDQAGAQPRVSASFEGYRLLIDRKFQDSQTRSIIHHGFYFGIMPLFLIAIALLRSKDRFMWPFFITAVFAALVGAGKGFFMFPFLVRSIPGFNMIRHTFPFSQFACFFLICVSGFGLKAIFSERSKMKIVLIAFITASALFLATKDNVSRISIFLTSATLICLLASLMFFKNRPILAKMAFLLVFSILAIDLCFANITLSYYRPYDTGTITKPLDNLRPPLPVLYPLTRTFYSRYSSPLSFNFFPIYLKEASLSSQRDDLMFLRNIRLHDMLRVFNGRQEYELALGVGGHTIYFTNKVKIFDSDIDKDTVIKEIFENFVDTESKNPRVFFQRRDIDFSIGDNNESEFLPPYSISVEKRGDPNRLNMVIDAPTDGFLVRLENFHRGWRAAIDDRPAKIYRANYAFQAIRFPAGKHKVVFEFKTIYTILFWIFISIASLTCLSFLYYLFRLKLTGDS